MARDQERPHCCQDPRPDAQVQALPPRHREEAAGHRPGHLGGPFLCLIRFILSLLFYKTLTMRAVSHLLKNNQPPPTHTRENKFGSHVRFIGLLKSKQVSRVTETFESLSPRFPCSEARGRGAPASPSAAAPSPVTLATGGLAYVYKTPLLSTAGTSGIFDARVESGGVPARDTLLSPEALGGPQGPRASRQWCPWLFVPCRGREQSGEFSHGAKERP